jgi:hypothetical protein
MNVLTADRATSLDLSFCGLALRVESTDEVVLESLGRRFARFARGTEEAAPAITVSYAFDERLHAHPADGRTVYASADATAVYSPAEDALYAFHAEGATMRCAPADGRVEILGVAPATTRLWVLTRPLLTLALMECARRRGLYPVHAACLASNGAGVLLCGPSGSGKSTLALALLRAGLDFLGDDLVFLRPERGTVRAVGFPDEVGYLADTAKLLSGSHATAEAQPGWPKARADFTAFAPQGTLARECTPKVLIFLTEGARPAVTDIGVDAALAELLPSMLLTDPETCTGHLEALAAAVHGAPAKASVAPRPDFATVLEYVHRNLNEGDR